MRFYLDYTNRRHKNYGAGTLAGYGTHTRGWNAGARVTCHGDKDERDSFSVYMTSGSGGSRGDRLLGTVHDTAEGPMWEPAGGDIPTGRVEIREVVREVRTPTPRDMPARKPERSADEDNPGIARHALQMAIDALDSTADHAFASGQQVSFPVETALLDLRAELARLNAPRITTTPHEGDDTWDAQP